MKTTVTFRLTSPHFDTDATAIIDHAQNRSIAQIVHQGRRYVLRGLQKYSRKDVLCVPIKIERNIS